MNKILPLVLIIFITSSCKQNREEQVMYDLGMVEQEMIPMTRQESPPPPPVKMDVQQDVNKKKIIKDGRMGLKVTDLQKAKNRVDSLVVKFDGYYSNENFYNNDQESGYNLNIRVPQVNFEVFISEIESGDGEVEYKGIDARDVTDQFIDLETRLENKRNYLVRYNELLQKAQTVKDIIEIEEKIRVLEEEIESTTGRLKYLNDQVDYSSLNLTITKPNDFRYTPANRSNFIERLKQSLMNGWYGFVDFIIFIIRLWPLWILVAIGLVLWKKLRKKN